jgi:Bacterial PH domain/Sodium:solute symporter family
MMNSTATLFTFDIYHKYVSPKASEMRLIWVGRVAMIVLVGIAIWLSLQFGETKGGTRNPLSSPALSLDRLCIHYKVGGKRRMVMISPADKESFLRVIAALVPGMIVDGSRAKRAPA